MVSVVVLFLVMVGIVLATTRLKMHPFLVLLLAGICMGFAAGLNAEAVMHALTDGFGATLGSIGIVIAGGSIIGTFLENSGGAQRMAQWTLRLVGEKKSPLAMSMTGYIVSIPVFCDSGFVVLSALNHAISRRTKISLAVLAVALGTGLYSTHVFVPPTPGPLAAAANLSADLGLVLLFGILVAIPVAAGGLLWAVLYCKRFTILPGEEKVRASAEPFLPEDLKGYAPYLPGAIRSFAPLILPIILIALKSISEYPTFPLGEGFIKSLLGIAGHPIVAILIGVFLSFLLPEKIKSDLLFNWVGEGIKNAGAIILITGAGGAFGGVLKEAEVGHYLGEVLSKWPLGIFLPFIIAAALKTAQGSSTVAMITTSALVAPLVGHLGLGEPLARVMVVLAIGAGAMTVSHANDSYFWVVSQFSDMDTATALRCHTVATLIQGLIGIMVIAALTWTLL